MILIRGEGPLLERVFVNLFENAVKYGQGRVKPIRVEVNLLLEQVEISVCDQGAGLSTEDTASLFAKFSRGKTESTIPGVGMGLAICKTIVELHGGQIYAENSPPGGACFTLRLPATTLQGDGTS